MSDLARKPSEDILLRPIAASDNAAVAALIRTVMPEFGATGEGFAIADPEVDRMFETYQLPRSAYMVAEVGGKIVAGAGIAPLKGADEQTCELQKMYALPEARGQKIGKQILDWCLIQAKREGFVRCYIETLETMDNAQKLYTDNGFESIDAPLGATGHYKCNRWYVKVL